VSKDWWLVLVSVVGGVLLVWIALMVALWFVKPDEVRSRDAMRFLPDVVRLLKRLAADPVCRAVFGFGSGCSWRTWRCRLT
jgi:hypothetical protein